MPNFVVDAPFPFRRYTASFSKTPFQSLGRQLLCPPGLFLFWNGASMCGYDRNSGAIVGLGLAFRWQPLPRHWALVSVLRLCPNCGAYVIAAAWSAFSQCVVVPHTLDLIL